MAWIDLVTLLALVQYIVFATMVGRARGLYGVKAPATSGHPVFERWFRVQANTLELLIAFVPALWIAARYWPPAVIAGIGAVYLVGRALYAVTYVRDPAARSAGFGLSMLPVLVLLIAALAGVLRGLAA